MFSCPDFSFTHSNPLIDNLPITARKVSPKVAVIERFDCNSATSNDMYLSSNIAVAIQQTCNVCLADSGLGDDVALCNIIQTQKACLPNKGLFPNLGTTHCYTIAGRYKYLNGSKDIHTGIARGCIDCTGKKLSLC